MRSGFCLLILSAVLIGACAGATASFTAEVPAPQLVAAADDQVTVSVIELFCQSCAQQIQKGCRGIFGVSAVRLDRHEHLVTLRFDAHVTTVERVLAAVDDVVASIR